MPSRRTVVIVGLAAAAVLLIVLVSISAPRSVPRATPTPGPTYAPPATPALANPHPSSGSIAALVDADWLTATAERTGIPKRALAAYAGAALRKAQLTPTCGVSWNTLAAIGYVESRHGTASGSEILAGGRVSPPIYGVALNGGSTEHIPDSDNGRFDKDTEYDRAVGPMQIIPQTWRNWRTDASADGTKDPQNIEDAVMAAANYLCRASPDMVGVTGWKLGIASYNAAPSYLIRVAEAAIGYAG